MPLIFVAEQDAHDKVIDVPVGTVTGCILLTRNNLTFRGAGKNESIIKLDDTRAWGVDAGVIVGGGPCLGLTMEDLTIDADMIPTCSAVIAANMTGGPQFLTLRRVRIRNYSKNTLGIGQGAILDAECVEFVGNGYAVQIQSTSLATRIRDASITGGTAGIGTSGADNTIPGIEIVDVSITLDFWCSVQWETVTPTAFGAQYVDVASHDEAARSLYDVIRVLTPIGNVTPGDPLPAGTQEFDRVETSLGDWAQVEADDDGVLSVGQFRASGSWNPIETPVELCSVYRVQLGKLFGTTPTRLSLTTAGVELGRWRYVDGSPTVFSANPTTDVMTMRGPVDELWVENPLPHRFTTGDGPVQLLADAGATLPGGLALLTNYYVIVVDESSFKLATSQVNALAGTAIDVTSAGSGEFGVARVPQIVAGMKVHVLRHGIANPGVQVRDLDSGAIHITEAARDAVLRKVTVRGGFSDQITVRGFGQGNLLEDCSVDLGGDMGITIDGENAPQNVKRCESTRSSVRGIYVTGGPSKLTMVRVSNNGLTDDGDGAYGLSGDASASETLVSYIGDGGRSGLIAPGAPLARVFRDDQFALYEAVNC